MGVFSKSKNGLSTVIHESVVEYIVDALADNEPFILGTNEQNVYVGAVLDCNDIGGLVDKKNEAKGSIIEEMNAGIISIYAVPELLADNKIIIMPTRDTLMSMDEFSLLTEVSYKLCSIDTDGQVDISDISVTYQDLCDVASGEKYISDIYHIDEDVDVSHKDEPSWSELHVILDDVNNEAQSDVDDDTQVAVNDIEDIDDTDADDEAFVDDADIVNDEFVSAEAVSDYGTIESIDGNDVDDIDDANDDSVVDVKSNEKIVDSQDNPVYTLKADYQANTVDVDEYELERHIARKYSNDELGLEISIDPFDVQFNRPVVALFDTERDATLDLNKYLNEMSKLANNKLVRLHNDNINKARKLYIDAVSKYCDGIRNQLDYNNPSTLYGTLYVTLCSQKAESEQQLNATVITEEAKLNEEWIKRLDDVAENAANMARQTYRERYSKQHDTDIQNIRINGQRAIEVSHAENVRKMNIDRRTEAGKRLDYCITQALNEVATEYELMYQKERELYESEVAELNAFIEQNKSDELAYQKAVIAEAERAQKMSELEEAHKIALTNLQTEYDLKKAKFDEDIKALHERHASEIETMNNIIASNNANHDMELTNLKASYDNEIRELQHKYNNVNADKDVEYKARIDLLQTQLTSLTNQYDTTIKAHKLSNKISIAVFIAALVAFGAVGFIIGEYVHLIV